MLNDVGSLRSKVFPALPNVRILIIYSILQGLYVGYIQIFWQHFLVAFGFAVALIGIMETATGAAGVLPSLLQTIGGRFSDRIGRKRLILAGSASLVLCWSVATTAFLFNLKNLIFIAYVLWSFSALGLTVIDSMMADNLPTEDRSRVYSVFLIAGFLPSSLTGYVVGLYSGITGPQVFLALAAALEGVGFIILFARLKENVPDYIGKRSHAFDLRDVITNAKKHKGYFAVGVADSLTWSISTSIISATLTAALHFSNSDFGALTVSLPIGIVLGTLPGGWLAHRFGPRNLLASSQLLGALMMFGWAFLPIPSLIPLYGLIWGFSISTWVPVQFLVSSVTFPQIKRGELMGAYGTSRGLARAVAPIIATLLFLNYGYSAPLVVGGTGVLLSIILILMFIKNDIGREKPIDLSA
ncbi:MAG: MFS transporter [Thaumarchaeota archaeon]|nr:MFS transporter [Nitrososphaerota archaeon]